MFYYPLRPWDSNVLFDPLAARLGQPGAACGQAFAVIFRKSRTRRGFLARLRMVSATARPRAFMRPMAKRRSRVMFSGPCPVRMRWRSNPFRRDRLPSRQLDCDRHDGRASKRTPGQAAEADPRPSSRARLPRRAEGREQDAAAPQAPGAGARRPVRRDVDEDHRCGRGARTGTASARSPPPSQTRTNIRWTISPASTTEGGGLRRCSRRPKL